MNCLKMQRQNVALSISKLSYPQKMWISKGVVN